MLYKAFPPIDYLALVFYCTNPTMEAKPMEVGEIANKIYQYSSRPIEEASEEFHEALKVSSVMPILALLGVLRLEVVLPHTYWTEEVKRGW